MQNELARIKVDSLNTEAHNVQLSETLQRLEEELTSRDRLIAKYQLEIRQRTDEIEKKMYRVDRCVTLRHDLVADVGNQAKAHLRSDPRWVMLEGTGAIAQ